MSKDDPARSQHQSEKNIKDTYDRIAKDASQEKYPHGPLNKSKETKMLEGITHDILEDAKNGTHNVEFFTEENKNFVKWRGEEISLGQLIKKSNFNHLEIPSEDNDNYAKLFQREVNDGVYPTYDEFKNKVDLTEKSDKRLNPDNPSPHSYNDDNGEQKYYLNYGQMLALNRYSYNESYERMNNLLRYPDYVDISSVPSTLLDVTQVTSALKSLPSKERPVVRVEKQYRLPQDIIDSDKQEVRQQEGIVSTSNMTGWYEPRKLDRKDKVEKFIVGASPVDIRPYSHYKESEYLFPPDIQLQYKGYMTNPDGSHSFAMEPTNLDLEHPVNLMERKKEEFQKIRELISNTANEIDINSSNKSTNQQINKLYTTVLDTLQENGTISKKQYQNHINNYKTFEEINTTSNLIRSSIDGISTEDKLVVTVDNWLQKSQIDSGVLGVIDENKKQKIEAVHNQIISSPNNIPNNILEVIKVSKEPSKEIQEMLKATKAEDRETVVFETLKQVRDIKNAQVLNTLIDASPVGAKKYIDYINTTNATENKEAQDKNNIGLITTTFKDPSGKNKETISHGPMVNSKVKIRELPMSKYVEEYYKKLHSTDKIRGTIGIRSAEDIAETISEEINVFAKKNVGKEISSQKVKNLFKNTLDILENNGNISSYEKTTILNDKKFTQNIIEATSLLNLTIPKVSLKEKTILKVSNFLNKFQTTKNIGGKLQDKLKLDTLKKINQIEDKVQNIVKTKGKIFQSTSDLNKTGVLENIRTNISPNHKKKPGKEI